MTELSSNLENHPCRSPYATCKDHPYVYKLHSQLAVDGGTTFTIFSRQESTFSEFSRSLLLPQDSNAALKRSVRQA